MTLTPEEFELIEKYLTGQLEEKQRQHFENQLENDNQLLKKVQHQLGVRDFFEHRALELMMQLELEEFAQVPIKEKRDFGRIKILVAEYAKAVAVLFIGFGLGWLVFRNVTSGTSQLLSTQIIKQSIFTKPDHGFGDQPDSVVTDVILQLYSDGRRPPRAFTYTSDTLKIYNVPPTILNANFLSLSYRDQEYYLKADTSSYWLKQKEIGTGTLELFTPKSGQK